MLAIHTGESASIMNLVNLLKFDHHGLRIRIAAVSSARLFIPTLILIDPFPLILSSTPRYRLSDVPNAGRMSLIGAPSSRQADSCLILVRIALSMLTALASRTAAQKYYLCRLATDQLLLATTGSHLYTLNTLWRLFTGRALGTSKMGHFAVILL